MPEREMEIARDSATLIAASSLVLKWGLRHHGPRLKPRLPKH